MTTKPIKVPGPGHPITVEPNASRVVVSIGGRVIADSREALTLREANYPPVQYIPRKDVDMSLLQRTEHATYCPYKGDCAYYSIPLGGERSVNAVWTYEAPYPSIAVIKGHVAFYPDRVGSLGTQTTRNLADHGTTSLRGQRAGIDRHSVSPAGRLEPPPLLWLVLAQRP